MKILDQINQAVVAQKTFFKSGKTLEYDFRYDHLCRLKVAIKKHEKDIETALFLDLGKPKFEVFLTETGVTCEEIDFVCRHLHQWMKPRKVPTPITLFPAKSQINFEPLGQVLIMGPWNYTFQLVLSPLVAAIAAGNTAILKPSHEAPNTADVIKKVIDEVFNPEYVVTIKGGIPESQQLLSHRFDHIFFTGGIRVAKIVAAEAAKHLTPVTLELGGKSPCIIDGGVSLQKVAQRIVWGKFLNAGQTCIAPDYLLVRSDLKQELLEHLKGEIDKAYGGDPFRSSSYGRIINENHFDRLLSLLKPEQVVYGGSSDRSQKYIAPTILDDVEWDDPVMEEEIFGPILPVISYENIDDLIPQINSRPKPLALYLFCSDLKLQNRMIKHIPFGGGCMNDVILHVANPHLPFGGVGDSGLGAYHGWHGFDLFSHKKSVLRGAYGLDNGIRYLPVKPWKEKLVKYLMG